MSKGDNEGTGAAGLEPQKKKSTAWTVIKTLAGIALMVSGGLGLASHFTHSSRPPVTHNLVVSVINGMAIGAPGWAATLSALSAGQPVTVANQSGTVLGSDADLAQGSSVTFKVPTESFYKITVGNFGTVTYSYNQVAGNHWKAPVQVS